MRENREGTGKTRELLPVRAPEGNQQHGRRRPGGLGRKIEHPAEHEENDAVADDRRDSKKDVEVRDGIELAASHGGAS